MTDQRTVPAQPGNTRASVAEDTQADDDGAACRELSIYISGLQDELAMSGQESSEQRDLREELAVALLEHHERGCGQAAEAGTSDLDAAISHASQLLARGSDDSRSQAQFIAAVAHYYRFLASENPTDLDIAISLASALAVLDGKDGPSGDALALLGDALATRYRLVPPGAPTELPDLCEAIRVLAVLQQLLADDDPAKVSCVEELGTLQYDRHLLRADGDHADLSAAIGCFRWLRFAVPTDDTLLAESTTRLGMALAERALQHGNAVADVNEAIVTLAAAGRLLAADDARHPLAALYLGVLLGVRFMMHDGGQVDRAVAISTLRDVLAHAELDQEQAGLARIWLSQLLLLHFLPGSAGRGPSPADFDWTNAVRSADRLATDEARAAAEEAIAQLGQLSEMPGGSPDFDVAVSFLLGTALLMRGAGGLPDHDLERIIRCFEKAARRIPPGAAGQPEITAIRAWMLGERANKPGHETDIESAAAALGQAAGLLNRDHPLRSVILHYRGKMLGRLGTRHMSAADLTAAIEVLTEALGQMPHEHPLRTQTAALLGAAFMTMTQYDVAALPIDRVVQLLSEATARPASDPAQQAAFLCCYGQALHLQAIRNRGGDFENAMNQVKHAVGLLPPDHASATYLMFALGCMLADQYSYVGNLESLDAAVHYLNKADRAVEAAGGPSYNPERTDRCSVRAVRGHVQMYRAMGREDAALFDEAIADLQSALDSFPAEHPLRARVASDLSAARIGRGATRQNAADLDAGCRQLVDSAAGLPAGSPDRTMLWGRAGLVCVLQAWLTADLRLLDKGIELLSDVADHPSLGCEDFRLIWGLGYGLVHRYDLSRNPADLDSGIARLEDGRRALAQEPGSPVAAIMLADLAGAYRKRADPARDDLRSAISAGILALREQVGDVLLQSGTHRGLAAARMATAHSAEVAGWALSAGLPAAAVEALELGRGLVLHAATALARLSTLLRAAGCSALAEEWDKFNRGASGSGTRAPLPWDSEHGYPPGEPDHRDSRIAAALAGSLDGPQVPSDLRHRVLLALENALADNALLAPPTVAEIASAMRLTGRDMVAYLLLTDDDRSGCAVTIAQDGAATVIPLPRLNGSATSRIDRYVLTRQRALRSDRDDVAFERQEATWKHALGDLCDWAWAAAVQPVLEHARSLTAGLIPQIVLIPSGGLGTVPWHAARTRDGSGRLHYAVENAVFSYAASGRQLIETANRQALPVRTRAVFVADPAASDIPWATWEVRNVRAAFYPGSSYLGSRPPDIATAARVLEWMPGRESAGASLIHLSCHALAGASPAASHLRLADDVHLPVSSILAQAQGRATDAPGGLVVLSACMTDLSTRDYDEALTLATAFLAAGAVSVVGSRWQVSDVRTALLMFMFHQYLTTGQPPASALRSAQLWMLDPERVVPAQMPQLLADEVPRHDLSEEPAWAAFTYQGQ